MPRLLLVDDNPSIQKIVASLLGPTAIEVSYASNASEALQFIEKGLTFDLALVDTTLPGIDGWELLRRMRSDARSANWPIALMSGVLELVDPEKVASAPIQGFIRKPVDLRDLPEKVASLIAIPVETSGLLPPCVAKLPSDILILEEQDLASEPNLAATTASDENDIPPRPQSEPDEDFISIELEELNFSELDKLAAEDQALPIQTLDAPKEPMEDFLETAPGDFGIELMPRELDARRRSPLLQELLSDPEFIQELAKEVAKNLSLRGIDV